MKKVQWPTPVLVTAFDHDFDGVADTAVGLGSCIPQIIESAQDVVMPKHWKREAEPAFVDDFAGSKRAEHVALEQIGFRPLAGPTHGRGFAPCSFVFEQSFEHTDGGMERRAPAFRCFAVPPTIFQLLAQELIGQCVVRFLEIRANAKDSAVDARLRFAIKERPVVERLNTSPLSTRSIILRASVLAGSRPRSFKTTRLQRVIRSHFAPPPQSPAGDCRARSCAPQPSVATRDLSAAIVLGASPVRSLMTCQRMAGSESRSHLRCAGRGA